MLRLSRGFMAFISFFLLASPQVNACMTTTRETLFFNPVPEQLPVNADVIANVTLLADPSGSFLKETAVNIVQVLKTSDARVRQGDKIDVKSNPMPCSNISHKNGDEGTIIAKTGFDNEGRLVLCLYSYDLRRDHIVSPWAYECLPDEVEATNPTRIAAEKGEAMAQLKLGAMYDSGREVRQNKAEALKWLHRAAESGDALAQYVLGEKYRYDKNIAEALKWLKLSADQGYAEAMYQLGLIYDYGHYGVKKDVAEATKWYRLAVEKGHDQARQALGIMQKLRRAEGEYDPAWGR